MLMLNQLNFPLVRSSSFSNIYEASQNELTPTAVASSTMTLPTAVRSTEITAHKHHSLSLSANHPGQKKIVTDFYLKTLDDWAKQAKPEENRTATMMHIRAWLADKPRQHNAMLKLNGLNLTELPPLPDQLRLLDASDNQLSHLNAAVLPKHLTYLCIADNCLSILPTLPAKLERLFVDNNKLTALPTALPKDLQCLNVAHNQIVSLPPLPNTLNYLNVNDNQLVSLPQLSSSLMHLFVDNNLVERLPEHLPMTLQHISFFNNRLRYLPEALVNLPSDCRIYIENNPLSHPARQSLQAHIQAPDYQGPNIFFSTPTVTDIRTARPLAQAVSDWYESREHAVAKNTWQAWHNQQHVADFSLFLDKLSTTLSGRSSGFLQQIRTWLDQLAADDDLRTHIFQVASDALGSCEDRVALTLNTMKKEGMNLDVQRGKYDHQLDTLIVLARQMFRLDQLEKIAYNKVASLKSTIHETDDDEIEIDEIEVYLDYQVKLRETLQLPLDITAMRFSTPYVTPAELDATAKQIIDAEKTDFLHYLSTEWSPWQSVLQRLCPTEYAQAQEKISACADTEFLHRQRVYLHEHHLEDNEMNRALSAQVVLDDIAREINGTLTQKFAQQHGLNIASSKNHLTN